ncbi:MAG: NACHT domain-containing NTPase [Leptolyngbya sp. BL-A-14]
MVFEAIAGGLVKAALPKVAGAIATVVKHELNPTELEKALKVGLQQSDAFDRGQKVNNTVFYRWTDKDADTFLAALLEHPDVQRELQKPLEQDGAPDIAILVQVAKQIAADRALNIQDETLEPWLKKFANAYFETISAIRFQVAKADYLKQLITRFDDVQFLGVALDRHEETKKQLAQIFVMPDVEEERRTSRASLEFDIRPGENWIEALETQGNRQSQLLQEQRLRAQLERSGRKFSARQLLNQHQKKIVLLGAPGSGKTTLMSFFAVTLAEQQRAGEAGEAGGTGGQGAITMASGSSTEGRDRDRSQMQRDPIAMHPDAEGIDHDRSQTDCLAEGIDHDRSQMQPDPTRMHLDAEGLRLDAEGLQTDADTLPLPILVRIRDWARTPDVTLPEYARQFAETTMSCKPLPKGFFEHWLNNGRALILLDGLDEVAEESKHYHLVQCIENFLGQYPQNRAIITSRPAGYKRDFFRTEEFPHYELQPFDDRKIEEFCDRWYRSRVQDTAEALRRKESLQKALNQQDRIKLLARNPLLLTIIALIHRYQARLSRERYKLYDKAVETLLTAWDDNKELSNQTVLKYLQLDDLRRLMESLAYWIHTQGTTGDREGGTLTDKDELIQKLCQEIKTLKQLQHYEAKAEAERFVKFIRDRTGLLNEQGQDCYAFVHKTFQEYLAAQDINYQADNEDDFEFVLTHIEQHLHDSHWREVLLLLIAQQKPNKAAKAIRKVLTANSLYEQWLHRDLLFAGRCLAEDPKGLQATDNALVKEILNELIAMELLESEQIGNKIREEVFQILCSLQESAFEAGALQRLKQNADRIDEYRLRKYQVGLGDAEAVFAPLLKQLQDKNTDVRRKAVKNLVDIGNSSDVVLNELVNRLQDDDSSVRSHAAFGLGCLKHPSDAMLNELINRLQDENYSVRLNAAFALGSLGQISDTVLQGLLNLLQDNEFLVRSCAVAALGDLGYTSDVILQNLLNLLQDEDSRVRRKAVAVLGKLGSASNIVLQNLLNLLHYEDIYTRSNAAQALVDLGYTSGVLVQELLNQLQHENDTNDTVRNGAAVALGGLRNASDVVIQALINQLQDEDSSVRSWSTVALVNLGYTPDALLQELFNVNLLGWFRHEGVKALGDLAKRSPQVEPAIVQWIEQHQDEECVGAGIDALWEIVEGE